MKFLATIGIALVLLTLESVIVKYLGLTVSRIDVTLALVVFLGLRAGTVEGGLSSFSIGYLLDVMSGSPTWLYCFLAVAVFLGVRLLSSMVDVRSVLMFVLFVAGADFAHGLLAVFFTWMTSDHLSTATLGALPLNVLLTVIAAALMWPLLRKFEPGNERPEVGLLR